MKRPALVQHCLEGNPSGARLTLIVAPAGFGKTTLLCELKDTLESQGYRTAWLNCDEGDHDTRGFVGSISHALQRAGIAPRGALRSPEELGRRCAVLPYPVAIVIDEFEVAACDGNDAALEAIARTAPESLRVVVAARSIARRPFVTLELDGCVRLIDATLVRFSEAEARTFLDGVAPPDSIQDFVARAEGWPFVLQLLRLHAERRAQSGAASCELVLPDSRISDYLASEVTSRLDEDVRSFIVETSLLPVISVDDAIGATGRDDCAAMLRRLEPLVPIVALEHQPLAARFHPLFRDHLLSELDGLGRAHVLTLHERVALHYERTQRVFEAVRCAVSGGLIELAVAILERAGGIRYVLSGGLTEARRTLALLPRAAIESRLKLRLMTVGALILRERGDDPPRELAAIEAELQEGRFGDQLDPTAKVDLATARSMVRYIEIDHTVVQPDWEELRADTERAAELAREDPRLWVVPLVLEILLLIRQGSMQSARLLIDAYVDLHERDARFHTAADAWTYRAIDELVRGELDQAELTAGRALTMLLNRDGHEEGHAGQMAHAVMGEIRYLRNDLRGALAHFDSIPAHNPYAIYEVYSVQDVWRALCDVAAGDVEAALDRLDAATARAADRTLPHLAILADAVRRDLLATHGGDPRPGRTGPRDERTGAMLARPASEDMLPWFTRAWIARASVSELVSRERHAEAARVAEAFLGVASASTRRLLTAEAWLLVARACGGAEPRTRALTAAGRALQLTAGSGAYRLFLDAGPDVLECVCEHARTGAGPAAEWARQIALRMSPLDRLSSRQRAVLRELCRGQSNKEIARVLQLSPETVKWYLKGIFEHFGLSSREAVMQAAMRAAASPPGAPPAVVESNE